MADAAYVSACQGLGIAANRRVRDRLSNDTVVTLQLAHVYIGNKGLIALCAAIPHLRCLRALGVSKNGIDNDGVVALCDAIHRSRAPIAALDLEGNGDITRVGGQALLALVARNGNVGHVALRGTNVTDYFAKRIAGHVQRNIDASAHLKELVALEVASLQLQFQLRELTPESTGVGSGCSTPATAQNIPTRGSSAKGTATAEHSPAKSDRSSIIEFNNLSHDECWAVDPPVDVHRRTLLGPAPADVVVGGARSERVVMTKPEDSELRDVFAYIDQYVPKDIELETKFVFPGKIEYVPALHAPDPLIAVPAPPGLSIHARSPAFPGIEAMCNASPAKNSMYWNFFKTAGSAPIEDGESIPDAGFSLFRLNDAALESTRKLGNRDLRITTGACADPGRKSLSELVYDPMWRPRMTSSSPMITDYCLQSKLKYNAVSKERVQPTTDVPRQYYLHRVIRHSTTEKLTSGSLNNTGTMLATSSYDMTCKVWDVDSGKRLHTLRGHEGHLYDVVWNSPLCDKLITASFDKTLKVWDVHSGELKFTLQGHEMEVVSVAVSPDGLRVASGAMDELVILWDITRGQELFTFVGHSAEIVSLDFSPNGELLVSGSMDETVRVWSTKTGECVHEFTGHTEEVGQVRFNCHGNMVLSSSIDTTCRLWDISTGHSKTLRGHTREVVDCEFSRDGWLCASASEDFTARVWDVLTGGCMAMLVGHDGGVCRVSFNRFGTELLTGSVDMTAKVWNVETGACKQTLRGHKGVVLAAYSRDSDRIMTMSKDNTCRLWRLEPEKDTLMEHTAVAICQHPTLLAEVLASAPEHVKEMLQAAMRRLFRSQQKRDEGAALSPSPLPQHEAPSPTPSHDPEAPPSPSASVTPQELFGGSDEAMTGSDSMPEVADTSEVS